VPFTIVTMHIKSIEIVGFKSYNNVKVELDSHHKRVAAPASLVRARARTRRAAPRRAAWRALRLQHLTALTFRFLTPPPRSRSLIVGRNGSGKSNVCASPQRARPTAPTRTARGAARAPRARAACACRLFARR